MAGLVTGAVVTGAVITGAVITGAGVTGRSRPGPGGVVGPGPGVARRGPAVVSRSPAAPRAVRGCPGGPVPGGELPRRIHRRRLPGSGREAADRALGRGSRHRAVPPAAGQDGWLAAGVAGRLLTRIAGDEERRASRGLLAGPRWRPGSRVPAARHLPAARHAIGGPVTRVAHAASVSFRAPELAPSAVLSGSLAFTSHGDLERTSHGDLERPVNGGSRPVSCPRSGAAPRARRDRLTRITLTVVGSGRYSAWASMCTGMPARPGYGQCSGVRCRGVPRLEGLPRARARIQDSHAKAYDCAHIQPEGR